MSFGVRPTLPARLAAGGWVLAALAAAAALVACSSSGPSAGGASNGPPSSLRTGAGSSGAGTNAPPALDHSASPVAASLPTFEIDATAGMRFALPEPVAPSGAVRVELINKDHQMPHLAQLFQLHKGVTMKQFKSELLSPGGEGAVVPIATPSGGPDAVGPGHRASVVVDLAPSSTYAVICTVPGQDGEPHYLHGMISSFTTAARRDHAKPAPSTSTITLSEFTFGIPTDVNWSAPITVINQGKQPHELQIFAPAPGRTVRDVKAYLSAKPGSTPPGPPPYRAYGGVAAIAPGARAQFDPQLPAGQYLLVCFVTDPVSHLPHFMKGMIATVTVG